jgi:hypothetical protein
MGYHVTIIRKKGNKIEPVSKQEWEAFVAKSPNLSFEVLDDGRTYAVIKDNQGQIKTWLDWNEGEIWTKNPEEDVLAEMIQIAGQLGARVRGDEGEYYKSVSETYYDPLEKEEHDRNQQEVQKSGRRRRIKQIIAHTIIFGFFAFMAMVVHTCSGK